MIVCGTIIVAMAPMIAHQHKFCSTSDRWSECFLLMLLGARCIDILGTHARLQAPRTGADCLHPMNPPPRATPGPTRHARAVCAASAGFCAHFAALAQPLGAWLGAGHSTGATNSGAEPPKPFGSHGNAVWRKIRPILKVCSPTGS